MEDMKKYRRIYRICPKGMNIPPKKKCLSEQEVKELSNGEVVIEEKIDGGIVGISWDHDNFRHLAMGKHSPIPTNDNSKKFYGFNKWIYDHYEKIMLIPNNWTINGEWMRASHNILYDLLPDYFMGFDIWDGYKYIDYKSKEKIFKEFGFEMIPALYIGKVNGINDVLELIKKSKYSSFEKMEGVIVKNYAKGLMGKFVTREFDDRIDEHWLKKPLIENKLISFDRGKEKERKGKG